MTPTTLAALLAIAACGLLATPAAAQSTPAGCTGDYVCSDPAVVISWPLDRWSTVRRANRQTAANRNSTTK
jgi:hypothetical protein